MIIDRSGSFLQDLERRNLIQIKSTSLPFSLSKHRAIYAGFDPTADSLHLGSLITLNSLFRSAFLYGLDSYVLIGGATAAFGDPSFRSIARSELSPSKIHVNFIAISHQIQALYSNYLELLSTYKIIQKGNTLKILNNFDWYQELPLLKFFDLVGRMKISHILSRESMKERLGVKEDGANYLEFSYQLLQAYDFYHLHKERGVTIQLGGSDQWGNICTGLELLSILGSSGNMTGAKVDDVQSSAPIGICTPLLTLPNGEKFGKSAGNAIWLKEDGTKIFDFYQYFMRIEDAQLRMFFDYLTDIPQEEMTQILCEHQKIPEKRLGQRILARYMTFLVHGKEGVYQAELLSDFFYNKNSTVALDEINELLIRNDRIKQRSFPTKSTLLQLIKDFNLIEGNDSQINSLFKQGGVYLNGQKTHSSNMLIPHGLFMLRVGKKEPFFIENKQQDEH